MKKQITSFILIIAMVITMVPMAGISVFAASDSTTIDVSDTSPGTLPTGVTYNSGTGVFTIDAGASGSSITVIGTTAQNAIAVDDGVIVELILSGASITVPSSGTYSPIDLQGSADVTLTLADGTTNVMSAVNTDGLAGIRTASIGGISATLTITGAGALDATGGGSAGDGGGAGIGGSGSGVLPVTGEDGGIIIVSGDANVTGTGGYFGAGIGGGGGAPFIGAVGGAGGNITVSGSANVTGVGGYGAAGIGGGDRNIGGDITLSGETVNATGGWDAAGIGGGYRGTGGSITISGGTVSATSGAFGAGIGGGAHSEGGNITISGGTVNAFGLAEYGGAGIGGGTDCAGGNITINGGTVNATGGVGGTDGGNYGSMGGAGIGGGSEGAGGTITISGGTVTATGDHNGAGIGGGRLAKGGTITINGSAIVTATGGSSGSAGIGGGGMAIVGSAPTGGSISISATATVKAASKGNGNPAINAVSGSGSVINAQLDNAISAGSDTYLKCNGNVLKLPANYKDFAFSVAASLPINAWSDSACTTIISGIVTTPGGIANIPLSGTIDAVPTAVKTASAFSLTVDLGGGNGSAASNSYASGAAVSIDAGAKSGYTFSSWTSSNGGTFDNAGSTETTFTMPGNATTITALWTQNSGGGGGGGSHTQPSNGNTIVIVDGKDYSIGTENKDGSDTTVTVDQSKLTEDIAKASDSSSVVFPVSANTNITAQLAVKNIEDMAKKDMTLTVQTGKISYHIKATAVDTAKITASLGMADTDKIPFNVKISYSNAVVNGTSVVISPVEFTITATYGGKTVNVDKFSSFVDRAIEITADQAKKITTAVVVEPNGSLRHVPTKVIVMDGKYYAVINSLTNSTYTVIWHPIEFSDVTAHWAKDTINDMGSRMVISGVGQGNSEPDRDITRAEFAAIVIRALGLAPDDGTSSFIDVRMSDWYCGSIKTAAEYGIITGYDAATFGPNDKITREQAMTMIARAMKITDLYTEMEESEISALIANDTDGTAASDYAKTSIAACLKTGVITGRSSDTIAPKDCITRAEVAVIVQRLLQKSNLI